MRSELEWHDVKKELPKHNQLILMWVKGGNGSPEGGYILDGCYLEPDFYSPDGEDHEPIAWMPRPGKPSLLTDKEVARIKAFTDASLSDYWPTEELPPRQDILSRVANDMLLEHIRFEVIDESGRQYVRYGTNVRFLVQDNGHTLKLYVHKED